MIIAQLVTVCSAEDDDDGEEGVASTSTINSVVATRKSVNRPPEPRLADLVVDFMSMVSGDFSSDPAAIGRTAPLTRPAHNKAVCTP